MTPQETITKALANKGFREDKLTRNKKLIQATIEQTLSLVFTLQTDRSDKQFLKKYFGRE